MHMLKDNDAIFFPARLWGSYGYGWWLGHFHEWIRKIEVARCMDGYLPVQSKNRVRIDMGWAMAHEHIHELKCRISIKRDLKALITLPMRLYSSAVNASRSWTLSCRTLAPGLPRTSMPGPIDLAVRPLGKIYAKKAFSIMEKISRLAGLYLRARPA